MNKVRRIEIFRIEGPIEDRGLRVFRSWAEANEYIRKAARTAPDVGYHKCDVGVLWEDGLAHGFRFELIRAHVCSFNPVAENALNEVRYWSGLHRPANMACSQYDKSLARYETYCPGLRSRVQALLNDHDFGCLTP